MALPGNIPRKLRALFTFDELANQSSIESPGFFLFLNIYFPINFLVVVFAGTFSWIQNIQNKYVIPPIILLNVLLVIPKLVCREIVIYSTIVLYPILVIINSYYYSVAVSCWYFVLINLFMISLLRKKFSLFLYLCIYHMTGLAVITYILQDLTVQFWYLNIVTNYVACVLLIFTFYLFLKSEQLVVEKDRLLEEKEQMSVKERDLTYNLRNLVKSVLHDYNNWTTMSNIGLTLSQKSKHEVNKLIEDGIRGSNELSMRLKAVLESNKFSFLQKIKMKDFTEKIKENLGGILPMRIQCDEALMQASVYADMRIFENCLMNLIRNATQAGATETVLEFSRDFDKTIALLVKDNGKGIPSDIAEVIFKARIDNPATEGSGIGLVGVKYNLLFMNCKIELIEPNSAGDKETMFKISGIKIASEQFSDELSKQLTL